MLSVHENEIVTQVGAGTPMGELMRRYWQPVLISRALPEPDCPQVRVRIVGEELVAFRLRVGIAAGGVGGAGGGGGGGAAGPEAEAGAGRGTGNGSTGHGQATRSLDRPGRSLRRPQRLDDHSVHGSGARG